MAASHNKHFHDDVVIYLLCDIFPPNANGFDMERYISRQKCSHGAKNSVAKTTILL